MAIMKNKNLSNSLAQQKKENKIDTNWHKFRQWWGYLQGHEIFRKNIQWETSEKDLDDNYKKQEAVRKVKPITKRILLIHATEETQENLEVDDGEEPLIRKGTCEGEKVSYVENLTPATSKTNEREEYGQANKRGIWTFSQRGAWIQKAWKANLALYHTSFFNHTPISHADK